MASGAGRLVIDEGQSDDSVAHNVDQAQQGVARVNRVEKGVTEGPDHFRQAIRPAPHVLQNGMAGLASRLAEATKQRKRPGRPLPPNLAAIGRSCNLCLDGLSKRVCEMRRPAGKSCGGRPASLARLLLKKTRSAPSDPLWMAWPSACIMVG